MKTAVVLFNLGGPDNLEAVGPFLFNLFFDPSIIALPTPFRWLIAKLIASRREHTAREIYAKLGGGSPLLPNTQAQADAVGAILGPAFKVFVAMRYWHPRASQNRPCRERLAAGPDRAAAALSAIFGINHRIVGAGLATRG